jgi:hypothetical protein
MLAELWCAVLVTMQDRSCDFRWTPVQRQCSASAAGAEFRGAIDC